MNSKLQNEIHEQATREVLLILTGPTGAGKDTLFAKLQKDNPGMIRVVTTTSRNKRPNESEGNPYYFISRDQFEEMISQGAFFEWVEFRGELYGTQKKTLEEALVHGRDVIWHIDAKGVKNIKEKVKQMYSHSVFIFLTAPSIEALEQRVHKDEGKVFHRWNQALVRWEMEQYDDCDYLVVNEDGKLDEAVKVVEGIIAATKRHIVKPTHTP